MLFGKRSREPEIKFDPDKQYAIIRSSICTGEKVAGFKNKEDGHFTEVICMLKKTICFTTLKETRLS